MPEKRILLVAILAAKERHQRAILAFAMAYLRSEYNGGAFTKTQSTQRAPLSLDSFNDLLDFAGPESSNLAYITSVFISYIGTDELVRLSNASL